MYIYIVINIYIYTDLVAPTKNQKNLYVSDQKQVVCTVLNERFGSFWPLILGALGGLKIFNSKDVVMEWRNRNGSELPLCQALCPFKKAFLQFFQNQSRIVLENWESSKNIKQWKLYMENLCFQHVWKSSFSACFGSFSIINYKMGDKSLHQWGEPGVIIYRSYHKYIQFAMDRDVSVQSTVFDLRLKWSMSWNNFERCQRKRQIKNYERCWTLL